MKLSLSRLLVWSLLSGALALPAFMPAAHSAAEAMIVLKGVVNKAAPPNDPAPDCTVIVYNKTRTATLAHDITNDRGQFHLRVPKGQDLIVVATGREQESMPGSLPVLATTRDPTEVKILLQPPKSATVEAWFNAGVMTAKRGAQETALAANVLYANNIRAASMFQFIKGAQSEAKDSFRGIDELDIFKAGDSASVSSGLTEAQSQWAYSNTVASYSALSDKSGGKLTAKEYVEILGFTAPTDPAARSKWEDAVQQSLGRDGKKEVVNTAQKLNEYVFDWKSTMDNTNGKAL